MADLIKGVVKYRVGDQWVGIRTLMGVTGPTGPSVQIEGVTVDLGGTQEQINTSIADALEKIGVTVIR